MPNITGNIGKNQDSPGNQLFGDCHIDIVKKVGALSMSVNGSQHLIVNNGVSNVGANQIDFNASWSNGIYGRSGTIQPASLRVKVIVRT